MQISIRKYMERECKRQATSGLQFINNVRIFQRFEIVFGLVYDNAFRHDWLAFPVEFVFPATFRSVFQVRLDSPGDVVFVGQQTFDILLIQAPLGRLVLITVWKQKCNDVVGKLSLDVDFIELALAQFCTAETTIGLTKTDGTIPLFQQKCCRKKYRRKLHGFGRAFEKTKLCAPS